MLALSLPDFTELVESTGPAVVNIRTTEKLRSPAESAEMNDFSQELQRRFGMPAPNQRRGNPRGDEEEQPQRRGLGSASSSAPMVWC